VLTGDFRDFDQGLDANSGTESRLHHDFTVRQLLKLKLQLTDDRQSVGQSVLVSGAHLGPVSNFSLA
jgi:hypothetical protein